MSSHAPVDAVNVGIPRALHARARAFAELKGVRLTSVVAVALSQYLHARADEGKQNHDLLPLLRAQTRR